MLSAAPHTAPTPIRESDYIPSKSIEPEILVLNLRILELIESCRTVPLPPPSPTSNSIPIEPITDLFSPDRLTATISKSQKLYARVDKLSNAQDKADFRTELQNVMYLLAFQVPEDSPAAHYLDQARRQAVADQINSAILCAFMIISLVTDEYTDS